MTDYPKFRGRWDKTAPVHDPAPRSLGPAPGARSTVNPALTIKSVPMGPGGGVPIPDMELEAMKAALAKKTGPLYNKGGPQYMTDEDRAQLKSGSLRRRN